MVPARNLDCTDKTIANEVIMGYVTYYVECCIVCRYNCFNSRSAESWYMYCDTFVRIHSRHTNVSAPSKLNNQWVGAVSFSYTYLQRACVRLSAFTVLTVVCLLYFEPLRVSVILLSVFHIHIYKEFAWVSAFFVLLVVWMLYFEPFRVSVILLARHNKKGRTRLVLTHPKYGCLLHVNALYSFERGSKLEYRNPFRSLVIKFFITNLFQSA